MRPLDQISIPKDSPENLPKKSPEKLKEEKYELCFLGNTFTFFGLKSLLGAADFSKAGDRNAKLSAPDEATREAARSILSTLTLEHLYKHPLTNGEGEIDSVMRVNYDIDLERFEKISKWTLGELKDYFLKSHTGEDIKAIGRAMTGVMVASLTKLLDTHELILVTQKIHTPTRARTTLGLPGTLSSRLQPNHPTDDLRGITMLSYIGLSLGSGDALIGVNPAIDTVESVSAVLRQLDKIRRQTGAPTQICVLSHIKTQLGCLEKGAPVEIMFQSLAGTEKTNLTEFDITVELLDHAYQTMAERGPLKLSEKSCKQFMYFETGQGSEFSYGKHNGIDMTTTEALTYGLARRYDPFMVNNVTGFIGPETHLDNFEVIISNLQDQFMGKLMGLPMGMAPCYTLHSKITLEGQQMCTQMLTAAGANYYMDVCLNTDRMLAYFDTSGHDNQTLREIYGKKTTPEYLEWALEKKIFARTASGEIIRGENWGNPKIFCSSETEFQELLKATPALYGLENAGSRPSDKVTRELKLNQALARKAIQSDLNIIDLQKITPFLVLSTRAKNKESHLNSPELGSRLDEESILKLKIFSQTPPKVQIAVTDGLSSEAIHHNFRDLFLVLSDGLKSMGLKLEQPILFPLGRVKAAEHLALTLKNELTILLIGERPGGDALASQSMSCYWVYQLLDQEAQKKAALFSENPNIQFEYTVLSNIYSAGLPALEAGSVIAEKTRLILDHKAAGNRLEARLKG